MILTSRASIPETLQQRRIRFQYSGSMVLLLGWFVCRSKQTANRNTVLQRRTQRFTKFKAPEFSVFKSAKMLHVQTGADPMCLDWHCAFSCSSITHSLLRIVCFCCLVSFQNKMWGHFPVLLSSYLNYMQLKLCVGFLKKVLLGCNLYRMLPTIWQG